MRLTRRRLAATLLPAVLLLTACNTADDEQADGAAAVDAEDGDAGDAVTVAAAADDPDATVELTQFAFEPDDVEISAGQTVVFTNADQTRHTVTADDELFDEELDGRDTTTAVTFHEPGEYAYFCRPHDFMTGTVTVTG